MVTNTNLKRNGTIFLSLAGFFFIMLVVAFLGVQEQIEKLDKWKTDAQKVYGVNANESNATVDLAKKIFEEKQKERRGEKSEFLDKIQKNLDKRDDVGYGTKDEWTKKNPFLHLAVLLTTFSKPETIKSNSSFWIGIVEVLLFAGVGIYFLVLNKNRTDNTNESSSLSLTS